MPFSTAHPRFRATPSASRIFRSNVPTSSFTSTIAVFSRSRGWLDPSGSRPEWSHRLMERRVPSVPKSIQLATAPTRVPFDSDLQSGRNASQRIDSHPRQVAALDARHRRLTDAGLHRQVLLPQSAPIANGADDAADLLIVHIRILDDGPHSRRISRFPVTYSCLDSAAGTPRRGEARRRPIVLAEKARATRNGREACPAVRPCINGRKGDADGTHVRYHDPWTTLRAACTTHSPAVHNHRRNVDNHAPIVERAWTAPNHARSLHLAVRYPNQPLHLVFWP